MSTGKKKYKRKIKKVEKNNRGLQLDLKKC